MNWSSISRRCCIVRLVIGDVNVFTECESDLARPSQSPFDSSAYQCNAAKKLTAILPDIRRTCADLIRDQHVAYQGWLALVANLDEIVGHLRQRVERVRNKHVRVISRVQKMVDARQSGALAVFQANLDTLKSIPLLKCLLAEGSSDTPATLYNWVERHVGVQALTAAGSVHDHITRIEHPSFIGTVMERMHNVDTRATDEHFRYIRNIGERYARLGQLFNEIDGMPGQECDHICSRGHRRVDQMHQRVVRSRGERAQRRTSHTGNGLPSA